MTQRGSGTHTLLGRASPPMGRHRFDNLVEELTARVGGDVPRYALWLRIHERGLDPERLTRDEVISLCGGFLQRFLRERGFRLRAGEVRRLRRAVASFEPPLATPERRLPAHQ